MNSPHFKIENPVLAALHFDAATIANAEVPSGPFAGDWWQHYLAEVIRQAQAELLAAERKNIDREKDELAAENAKLREQLQAVRQDCAPSPIEQLPQPEAKPAAVSFMIDPTEGVKIFNPFKQD